jgi:hypothetical protein
MKPYTFFFIIAAMLSSASVLQAQGISDPFPKLADDPIAMPLIRFDILHEQYPDIVEQYRGNLDNSLWLNAAAFITIKNEKNELASFTGKKWTANGWDTVQHYGHDYSYNAAGKPQHVETTVKIPDAPAPHVRYRYQVSYNSNGAPSVVVIEKAGSATGAFLYDRTKVLHYNTAGKLVRDSTHYAVGAEALFTYSYTGDTLVNATLLSTYGGNNHTMEIEVRKDQEGRVIRHKSIEESGTFTSIYGYSTNGKLALHETYASPPNSTTMNCQHKEEYFYTGNRLNYWITSLASSSNQTEWAKGDSLRMVYKNQNTVNADTALVFSWSPFTGGFDHREGTRYIFAPQQEPVSIGNHVQALNELKLYPNPAAGFVRFTDKKVTGMDAEVLDIGGRTVLRARLTADGLDVSRLSPGHYIIKVSKDSYARLVKE